MSIDRLAQQLAKLERELPDIVLDALVATGFSQIGLTKNRIQQTGKDAAGSFFTDYSKGYAAFREKQGRQTNIKDFTLTGSLFESIGVTFSAVQGNKVVVVIEPKDSENQKKLLYLEQQEGKDILALSNREIELIAKTVEARILNRINAL